MRVLIAPDSFKESVSAHVAAEALAEGWKRAFPSAELIRLPLADGGEGTVAALVKATGGRLLHTLVSGPTGKVLEAEYGFLGDGRTAVIEMAAASGLHLVPLDQRNPLVTTTRGTGDLILAALDEGARRLIVGIGGSATNDGGAGMAQALGFSLLDAEGNELEAGGGALRHLVKIDSSGRDPRLDACEFVVASDVDNPLCGPRGASEVFGPQKGATPEAVLLLDRSLEHFANVIKSDIGIPVKDMPGAGAAGGLGAGLLGFARARIQPGFDVVAEACGLAKRIERADLVITGEGRLDAQTLHGKAPSGVARLAAAQGVPVIAVAGQLGPGHKELYEIGVTAMFSLCNGPMSLDDAVRNAEPLLKDCGETIARLWQAGIRSGGKRRR